MSVSLRLDTRWEKFSTQFLSCMANVLSTLDTSTLPTHSAVPEDMRRINPGRTQPHQWRKKHHPSFQLWSINALFAYRGQLPVQQQCGILWNIFYLNMLFWYMEVLGSLGCVSDRERLEPKTSSFTLISHTTFLLMSKKGLSKSQKLNIP